MAAATQHTARAYSPERVAIGLAMYERANDARRNGNHAAYVRLTQELIAFNRETAAIARANGGDS